MKVNKHNVFKACGYIPHQTQKQFHNSDARFRVLMCGRRWGKSLSAAMEAICAMMKPDQLGWVVAPSYELAEKIFREVFWLFNKLPALRWMVKKSNLSRGSMIVELHNGSILLGKSADNPTSLIGEGLDFLIIDEAARIKMDVWNQALRPTLADKKGWVLFVSTPLGMNWFYDLYKVGQEKKDGFESWSFPSVSNPYLDPVEIDAAKQTTPLMIFMQEWMAEPVAEQDIFFNWEMIDSCVDETIPQITKKENWKNKYWLGVDVARLGQDSSVFTVTEKRFVGGEIRVVFIQEIKQQYLTQAIGFCKKLDELFGFEKIYIDETGLGAGVVDGMSEAVGRKVEGITFTIKTKEDLYSNLKVMFEKGMLKIPKLQKLIYQLKDLRYEYKSSGNISLHHSDNGHDDFPDSLALAVAWNKFKPASAPYIA